MIDGDTIYAAAAENGGDNEAADAAAFSDLAAKHDANHDGSLTVAEFEGDQKMQALIPKIDLDLNGSLEEKEWDFYRARMASQNSLMAIRHGGRGDVTGTNVLWTVKKFIPRCTSPLLYEGVLYMVEKAAS